jgi:hypothetical protein
MYMESCSRDKDSYTSSVASEKSEIGDIRLIRFSIDSSEPRRVGLLEILLSHSHFRRPRVGERRVISRPSTADAAESLRAYHSSINDGP